jgi:preprotein translocase subunit SecD
VSLRTRATLTAGLMLLMTWAALPSFFSEPQRRASWWLSDQAMNLGLDLRGGVHWLLRVDETVAYTQELKHFGGLLQEAAEDARVELKSQRVREDLGEDLVLEIDGDLPRLHELVEERIGSAVQVAERDGGRELRLADGYKDDVLERAVSQAIEVLEQRVNTLGVREPVIAPQGTGRILVQMPGGDIDPASARQVLENTTFLEFKKVLAFAPTEELLRASYPEGLPPDTQVVLAREGADGGVSEALLVPKDPVLTGAELEDARVGFDRRNRPEIQFAWNAHGAQVFRDFTAKNIGQRMAAIIDDVAVTAPTIQDRIGRSGVITGRFTLEEAKMVAVSLRSGALPIPLQIEEERSVGPALGRDSIRAGLISLAAGAALVFVFMAAYYSTAGWFANLTQIANLIVIVGLMSVAGATLTLPGIAGLVLTVGMAVDANVLIYERIREELRRGAAPRNAVAIGFQRAGVTIWDSNITTMIAALILLYLGSGPVKGFGVTLSIGLVSTVFCALVITRLLMEWAVLRNPKQLRI